MLISRTILTQTKLMRYPYNWCYYENIMNDEFINEISINFPADNYVLRKSNRDDKSYEMLQRILYDSRQGGFMIPEALTPIWIDLMNELISENYITALSDVIKLDLSIYDIEINCWRYGRGGWLSPHTDKPEKVVSQLFYFNDYWLSSWGGSLRILKSNNIEDYYKNIYPGLGNSVLLMRSNNSWHGVLEQKSPENVFRNVLQLIFWQRNIDNATSNY